MTVETLLLIFVGMFCIMGTLYFGFGFAERRQQNEDYEVQREDELEFQRGVLQRLVNIDYHLSKKEEK